MKPYAHAKDSGYNVSPKRRKTKAVKKTVRQQIKKFIKDSFEFSPIFGIKYVREM